MPEMLPNRHEFRRLPWVFRYYLYIMATALLIAGVVVVGRLLVTFEPLHIGGYSIVPPVVCPSDPIRTTVSVSVEGGPYTIDSTDIRAWWVNQDGVIINTLAVRSTSGIQAFPKRTIYVPQLARAPDIPGTWFYRNTHHKHRALSDPVPEHRPHLPAHKAHDKA